MISSITFDDLGLRVIVNRPEKTARIDYLDADKLSPFGFIGRDSDGTVRADCWLDCMDEVFEVVATMV